jgi:DNA-binding CsgD family transcriptional regulator
VIRHLVDGKTAAATAVALGLSAKTVDVHRTEIYKVLRMNNVVDLTHYAIASGLVSIKSFDHLEV